MSTTDWQALKSSLAVRAARDPAFRTLLLADPAAALAQAGLTLPPGTQLQVTPAPNASGLRVAVVTALADGSLQTEAEFELTEEELDQVVGGTHRLPPGYEYLGPRGSR